MLDDNSGWHQQQQLAEQWLERDCDIAFGSFAKDFKQFVLNYENAAQQALAATDSRPITAF